MFPALFAAALKFTFVALNCSPALPPLSSLNAVLPHPPIYVPPRPTVQQPHHHHKKKEANVLLTFAVPYDSKPVCSIRVATITTIAQLFDLPIDTLRWCSWWPRRLETAFSSESESTTKGAKVAQSKHVTCFCCWKRRKPFTIPNHNLIVKPFFSLQFSSRKLLHLEVEGSSVLILFPFL